LEPEDRNSVPSVYKTNLRFLVMGQEGAPWTGYYADFYGVKLAVSNFLGIWFEIRRREGSFEAFRVVCEALNLQNHPLPGTSISLLMMMSERLPTTRPGSPQTVISADESPWPPDPDPPSFDERIAAEGKKKDEHIWLEGILPESYEGDQRETQNFLMQFRRYILMNRGAEIAKDPFKRCGLFLSLMKGPKVKGWVQKTYDWLNQVEMNPDDKFSPGSNPWEILEKKFHDSFIDYVEHERAQDELTKLKMTGGDVDGYIASFEFLSYRAGMNPD
jgi:hypothetical protein